jgi:hypothetical protein
MVVIDIPQANIKPIHIKSNAHLVPECLASDDKIDDVLHVITVISNVCEFKRRYQLMKEFIERMNKTSHIKLYVVELAYGVQEFKITDPTNPQHLQLRTQHALWHKESMINCGVKKLLPPNWKSFAWIDGDVEFDNPNWASDTLKLLTKFDVVQLFTYCFDLDENNMSMNVWQSYGHKYCNGEPFQHARGLNYWHSGYAWSCTRQYYEKVGGLYEHGIIGSGDYIMTQGYLKNTACADKSLKSFASHIKFYNKYVLKNIRIGYLPSNIRHHYHGSKKNRQYIDRNQILIKYNYDPYTMIKTDENGLIIPSDKMPTEMIDDIRNYFFSRLEDD